MLLILVLSQKQREKIDGKHESLSGGTVGRDGKEHSIKGSPWSIFLHRNHSELLFRRCATRLSVAVLDIAFQVM